MAETEWVAFNVLQPGHYAARARCRPGDRCESLRAWFPGQNVLFVYKGEILDWNRCIAEYRIQPNDTVVVIQGSCDRESPIVTHWLRMSRDGESFETRVAGLLDTTTRRETMRLRDLAIMRRDGFGRRPWRPRMALLDPPRMRDTTQTTITGLAAEMSTGPLPVMWHS
jgi:hypothetical protein